MKNYQCQCEIMQDMQVQNVVVVALIKEFHCTAGVKRAVQNYPNSILHSRVYEELRERMAFAI